MELRAGRDVLVGQVHRADCRPPIRLLAERSADLDRLRSVRALTGVAWGQDAPYRQYGSENNRDDWVKAHG